MHTVILYFGNRMVSSSHYDSRYAASEAFDRFDLPAGHNLALRDRFGCLASRSN